MCTSNIHIFLNYRIIANREKRAFNKIKASVADFRQQTTEEVEVAYGTEVEMLGHTDDGCIVFMGGFGKRRRNLKCIRKSEFLQIAFANIYDLLLVNI